MFKYLTLAFISFIFSVFIGRILPYSYKTIYIYPTPKNQNKFIFKDKVNNCYKIKTKKQNCNKASILPIQI